MRASLHAEIETKTPDVAWTRLVGELQVYHNAEEAAHDIGTLARARMSFPAWKRRGNLDCIRQVQTAGMVMWRIRYIHKAWKSVDAVGQHVRNLGK